MSLERRGWLKCNSWIIKSSRDRSIHAAKHFPNHEIIQTRFPLQFNKCSLSLSLSLRFLFDFDWISNTSSPCSIHVSPRVFSTGLYRVLADLSSLHRGSGIHVRLYSFLSLFLSLYCPLLFDFSVCEHLRL